jgi:hypothetical protein
MVTRFSGQPAKALTYVSDFRRADFSDAGRHSTRSFRVRKFPAASRARPRRSKHLKCRSIPRHANCLRISDSEIFTRKVKRALEFSRYSVRGPNDDNALQ